MLPRRYLHGESEQKWQRYWEDKGIFRFGSQPDGVIYSIDTPPPTVSGAIHIGHVYSYTHAEMVARYWRMRGRRVFYPFGFDDNGLPTERLVEREHGIKAADMGREEFVRLCLETTGRYEQQFKALWRSLGFSVDWTLQYSTIDDKSRRISQLSFLDVYERGGIYQDASPCAWCTECMTSVAQAEVEAVESESFFNYIAFFTDSGEELVISTTRPELIPACVAVFVHPDDEDRRHLVGREAMVPVTGHRVPIMCDRAVDLSVGTGAVMCCTFGDQQDIRWWRRYQLDSREMIGRDGRIKDGFGRYSGMHSTDARSAILEDLDTQGHLRHKRPITHPVACHERCGTPIEYRSSRQWFIRIMDKKDRFLEAANRINWHPAYMKHRYVEWVNNLGWDWCISRQRHFGVPFPVWYCRECGSVKLADREQLPVDPLSASPRDRCECGSRDFDPERDVMDTWATSSVTPFINAGWDGRGAFEYPVVPMNLRPQAHDIIRTWAFYTIVKSVYHLDDIPWSDVMISGFVMAEKGEKLSKSKENAGNSPEALISAYSADVVRLWTSTGRLGTDILFSEEELRNNRRLPVKLWNAARFVLLHLRGFRCPADRDRHHESIREAIDRWLVQRTYSTQSKVGEALESFEICQARELLDAFFWNDFCDNYLEVVKERLYRPEKRGEAARESARATLYTALLAILQMYSIFTPHIAEEIYQAYYREQERCDSVSILRWGRATPIEINDDVARGGNEFFAIVAMVRKFKSEHGLSQGAEIECLTAKCSPDSWDFMKAASLDLKAVTKSLGVELVLSAEGQVPAIEIRVRPGIR